jgi:agmatinase
LSNREMESAGEKGFGGLEAEFAEFETSKVVILPVPFDKTSSWQKGSNRGPGAIIDASVYLELFDLETSSEVFRRGIHTLEPLVSEDCESMVRDACARVSSLIDAGKLVVTLGGEHTVSVGPALAHADRFRDLTVLQLDAHTDLRDEYNGQKYNHACTMARIRERANDTIAVGIRSMDSSELAEARKFPLFLAHDIVNRKNWIPGVVRACKKNVYVTIDLDVFENGIMPSTGTPEPGGLGWYDVTGLLALVAKKRNVVGFDVTELCPSSNRAPDFLAAKLVYQFLSYIFFYGSGMQ